MSGLFPTTVTGRVASGGALAPQPPLATRNQQEFTWMYCGSNVVSSQVFIFLRATRKTPRTNPFSAKIQIQPTQGCEADSLVGKYSSQCLRAGKTVPTLFIIFDNHDGIH